MRKTDVQLVFASADASLDRKEKVLPCCGLGIEGSCGSGMTLDLKDAL